MLDGVAVTVKVAQDLWTTMGIDAHSSDHCSHI
jgi:hypothetical protein